MWANIPLQALASDLLAKAVDLTQHQSLQSRLRFSMCEDIIMACLNEGRRLLEAKSADALPLLDSAFQLITGHLVKILQIATEVLP